MKVAIVHDWLVGGGAERVVQELHAMYPDAPIYTSYSTAEWQKKLDGKVVTGYLQNWPFSTLRKFLPVLRARWFSRLDLSGFDLVISSSGNGEAMGVRVPNKTVHISYCHSPTHFYWRHYEQYIRRPGFGIFNPLARLGLRLLVGPLRRWDFKAAQLPNYIIANSTHIQSDIKKYYKRDSDIIFPPVNIDRFKNSSNERKGFVTVGRLVPAKHTELIVEACTELGLPLTVVGRGPEFSSLKRMAGRTVTFDNNASDEAVNNYMKTAEAFVFAAFEDFGITPVEALAAGTPVIAYQAGGALDYIVDGKTGVFFDKQNAGSLMTAIEKFQTQSFDRSELTKQAARFSSEVFRKEMKAFIDKVTAIKHG